MELDKDLNDLITRELDALGYELVKGEAYLSGRRRTIRIFIDHPDRSVTIDDCVRVTKALGLVLDGAEGLPGPYNLEVSSPGFSRPLTKPVHFERFRGERARVEYLEPDGGKTTAIGEITGVAPTAITLSVDGAERLVAFEKILRASLHPEDRGAPGAKRGGRGRRGKRPGKRF
jgi:ribosome maturation factor RimP